MDRWFALAFLLFMMGFDMAWGETPFPSVTSMPSPGGYPMPSAPVPGPVPSPTPMPSPSPDCATQRGVSVNAPPVVRCTEAGDTVMVVTSRLYLSGTDLVEEVTTSELETRLELVSGYEVGDVAAVVDHRLRCEQNTRDRYEVELRKMPTHPTMGACQWSPWERRQVRDRISKEVRWYQLSTSTIPLTSPWIAGAPRPVGFLSAWEERAPLTPFMVVSDRRELMLPEASLSGLREKSVGREDRTGDGSQTTAAMTGSYGNETCSLTQTYQGSPFRSEFGYCGMGYSTYPPAADAFQLRSLVQSFLPSAVAVHGPCDSEAAAWAEARINEW